MLRDSIEDLTASLCAGIPLTAGEVARAVGFLLGEGNEPARKAAFLRALSEKGETAQEVAAFVEALLERAVDPALVPDALPGPMIDVCGTGGDKLHLINVSTASMFVLAAGGAIVVKHGNRSVTSQCGGADVLEALGIAIALPPADLRRCVERAGCGFLFAPAYHPAFKVIGPIRKALADEGRTTVFNLLGPLLNPARPQHQLVGIFSQAALPTYAGVLHRLGRRHAWAVHGCAENGAGMDEVSTMAATHIHPVKSGAIDDPWQLTPEALRALGVAPATLAELRGGSRDENARILHGILDGAVVGPKRDLVAMNAAAGFVVAGLAPDIAAGFALANEQIDSGRALAKLRALQEFR